MPAAVGVVQQAGLIAANWLAIFAALVVSTVLTLVVTVYTFRAWRGGSEATGDDHGGDLYRDLGLSLRDAAPLADADAYRLRRRRRGLGALRRTRSPTRW